ncbi:hypothetical protein EMCRGX_G014746 [Ephydatia muelleri]
MTEDEETEDEDEETEDEDEETEDEDEETEDEDEAMATSIESTLETTTAVLKSKRPQALIEKQKLDISRHIPLNAHTGVRENLLGLRNTLWFRTVIGRWHG